MCSPQTAKTLSSPDNQLEINCYNSTSFNVFLVNLDSNAYSKVVIDCPNAATVLVNVNGTSPRMRNVRNHTRLPTSRHSFIDPLVQVQFSLAGGISSRTIAWNFFQASNISFSSMDFEGTGKDCEMIETLQSSSPICTVLAPHADVLFTNTNVFGSVYSQACGGRSQRYAGE